ncbi:MAG: NTP transferase domain-containing protein, partial [Candidatus Dormibacteraeota bacterium]|nr:NTP transferase domain-containing protein [Candidatus Dormibacteraeota bacterium]
MLPVPAVVLAAGAGTRMGGDKMLRPLRGRPLVVWAVSAAREG